MRSIHDAPQDRLVRRLDGGGLTLAFALSAAGFAPGATTPATEAATVGTDTADVATPPTVQVDKVYIAAPKPQRTVTVHKVLKTAGGESESEGSEGGD